MMDRRASILVADDDRAIRTVLSQALARLGHEVKSTGTAAGLWTWVEKGEGDLVITDVIMPDENGLDLLPRIRRLRPDLRVIVMSAQNTLLTAVKASERGAFDYLPKPFDLNELVATVRKALTTPARAEAVEPEPPAGTGKELVARALHDYGKRSEGPFVAINMAAIPRELIESELFGHEKGAFTGATVRSTGRFEQAQGGTLFLDEIGDMPLEAQTRLLRVLQEGEYTTVGGRAPIRADVRIVAATHRDLRQLIRQGLFREDLFYRINVVPIRLPALRERAEDIPDLARHFFSQMPAEGLPVKHLDRPALDLLQAYPWPGNVRELENLCRRLAALYTEETIGAEAIGQELSEAAEPVAEDGAGSHDSESLAEAVERHLAAYFAAHQNELPASGLYDRIVREVERPLISLCLSATRGNQIRAAEVLGLNRNTLRKKIRELDIPVVRGVRS